MTSQPFYFVFFFNALKVPLGQALLTVHARGHLVGMRQQLAHGSSSFPYLRLQLLQILAQAHVQLHVQGPQLTLLVICIFRISEHEAQLQHWSVFSLLPLFIIFLFSRPNC